MKKIIKNIEDAMGALAWDMDGVYQVVKQLKDRTCLHKNKQARVIEFIDSAAGALAEARKAALKLPTK